MEGGNLNYVVKPALNSEKNVHSDGKSGQDTEEYKRRQDWSCIRLSIDGRCGSAEQSMNRILPITLGGLVAESYLMPVFTKREKI